MSLAGNISTIGHSLARPESVLTTVTGDVFASHKGHGVMRICPDGRQFLLNGPAKFGGTPLIPNGIALRKDGSFLVANISDAGGLYKLDAEGLRLFHDCSGSTVMPPVNFVTVDTLGKTWVSISSSMSPRSLAYRRNVKNGYVGLINENGEFEVVLEGLHYTNEVRPDYENGWLYVAETFGQKITRVRLDENGVYGEPELFVQFPTGAFVDGLELDGAGGLYAACIVSSELYHVDPDGNPTLIVGERHDEWVQIVETALDHETMSREHFDSSPSKALPNISSVAFIGEGREQVVCGNLLGSSLPIVNVPQPGPEPVHWNVNVPDWGEEIREKQ